MQEIHPFAPVFDRDSRILILGSFPSVRSREEGFYYGHPRNRFWQMLAALTEDTIPRSVEEKRAFLAARHIALWDVIASCEIEASADSSIRGAKPNDLSPLLAQTKIEAIFTNGKIADRLYRASFGETAVCLPSTSPANAAWTLPKLIDAWRVILPPLGLS